MVWFGVGILLVALVGAYFLFGPKAALQVAAAATSGLILFFVLSWVVSATGYGYGIGLALGRLGTLGALVVCIAAAYVLVARRL